MAEGVIMRAVREEARRETAKCLAQVGLKTGSRGRPQSLAVLVQAELKKLGVHLMPKRRTIGGSEADE